MLSHQISGGKHCILLLIGRLRCERCLRLARATKGRAARHLNDAQQAVAGADAPRDATGLPIAAIEWLDVGFEDGDSAPPDIGPCARRLPRLVFERQAYEQALHACLLKSD